MFRAFALLAILCVAQAPDSSKSAESIAALKSWIQTPATERPSLSTQSFAATPLTKHDAKEAARLLWADHAATVKSKRQHEWDARAIKVGEHELKFDVCVLGQQPPAGRSLFISMHGGGSAPTRVNDQQWENQKRLYTPDEGVYVAPRAPTDAWNMWHQAHIDALFERLITDAVVFADVDPDRVYLTGYSAGGDGVYQLAPRMADRFAAAAMMAGHPNEASPLGLRNLPFAIHVGANDSAFDRNKIAADWGKRLDDLQRDDPKGYVHEVELHRGKSHWMDREDAKAISWMARFRRDTTPDRVVWKQDDVTRSSFYWLAVSDPERMPGAEIVARRDGQEFAIETSPEHPRRIMIRLADGMPNLDLDREITIAVPNLPLKRIQPRRRIATLASTLAEREDPKLMFSAEFEVNLPQE